MPPKVISGGDNPYDIHDAKLSSSATAHESSSVTAHEISNNVAVNASEILMDITPDCFLIASLIFLEDLLRHLACPRQFFLTSIRYSLSRHYLSFVFAHCSPTS